MAAVAVSRVCQLTESERGSTVVDGHGNPLLSPFRASRVATAGATSLLIDSFGSIRQRCGATSEGEQHAKNRLFPAVAAAHGAECPPRSIIWSATLSCAGKKGVLGTVPKKSPLGGDQEKNRS